MNGCFDVVFSNGVIYLIYKVSLKMTLGEKGLNIYGFLGSMTFKTFSAFPDLFKF